MKTCLICKTSYEVSNFKRYCSHECYLKAPIKLNGAVITTCLQCGESVLKYKSQMCKNTFCNSTCAGNFNGKKLSEKGSENIHCSYCNKIFNRRKALNVTRKTKEEKLNFCSQECNGLYAVKLGKGIFDQSQNYIKLRSDLELFIESKIGNEFPFLDLEVCNRTLMNGPELDFYIPSIKLAIEINGIFHYSPIHGEDLLFKIQTKDKLKIDFCFTNKIQLIVVKSTCNFYDRVGNKIWNNEIKPELLKLIPFCENTW